MPRELTGLADEVAIGTDRSRDRTQPATIRSERTCFCSRPRNSSRSSCASLSCSRRSLTSASALSARSTASPPRAASASSWRLSAVSWATDASSCARRSRAWPSCVVSSAMRRSSDWICDGQWAHQTRLTDLLAQGGRLMLRIVERALRRRGRAVGLIEIRLRAQQQIDARAIRRDQRPHGRDELHRVARSRVWRRPIASKVEPIRIRQRRAILSHVSA